MRLGDLGWIICRFDDPGDHHGGTITEEPTWKPNPYDETKPPMLVIMLADGDLTYELRARSRMVPAIHKAVLAAGATTLRAGGHLDVTFVEFQGQYKIYTATYEQPDHCACADPREPIGTAGLESSSEDPGDDQTEW
jgi:hypothetical protein